VDVLCQNVARRHSEKIQGAEYFLRSLQSLSSWRIPRILWNANVHYRVDKSPPLGPAHSQNNVVHTLTSQLLLFDVLQHNLPFCTSA